MNITSSVTALLLSGLALTNTYAQTDKKEKVPVYNYVIDDPMDAFGQQPAAAPQTALSLLVLPEFYSSEPAYHGDTLYKYEVYDSRNEIMGIDSVRDFAVVKFVSLFKSYTDRTHTYIDSGGKEQLLPVSSIITRYDRVGADGWLRVNYANNKYTKLKEFKNEIVKTDTSSASDPKTGVMKNSIHKYYKVGTVK
jgi:hypothetical protein